MPNEYVRSPIPFSSKKIIILEGLHTLYSPALRELVDFSVFVDPDQEIKYAWKRQRDISQRGYSSVDVSNEIVRREADYEAYVKPQRCMADAIIRIKYSRVQDWCWGRQRTFIRSRFS